MQQPYQADDIIVLPSTRGYLIGRVLAHQAQGPWWEYIETEPRLERALARARALAADARTRAWIYDGDGYRAIPVVETVVLKETSAPEYENGA
jgi:hypothetical protein